MANKQKTYFSIRVVEAESQREALDKVQACIFEEEHKLCDRVLTAEELIRELLHELENNK